MSFQHRVKLSLDGPAIEISGVYDGYHVTQDMFAVASPWSYTIWHSVGSQSASTTVRDRTAWSKLKTNVKLGDPMTLYIDDAAVCSGLIETATPFHDPDKGAGMVLSGRDVAGPLVRWDADPKLNLRNQTLKAALEALFLPFQISGVVIGADVDADRQVRMGINRGSRSHRRSRRTQQVDHYHPKIGEKAWAVAEEICRRLGYLLWTGVSTDGGLLVIVDVPAYSSDVVYQFRKTFADGSDWAMNPDDNVLAADSPRTIADVPTEVNVYGSNATGDTPDGRNKVTVANDHLAGFQATYSDNDITNIVSPVTLARIRHKQSSRCRTQTQLQQEGTRLLSDANRDWRLYRPTVQGHGQFTTQGQQSNQTPTMYAINTMAHVTDDICALNEAMLIYRVEFMGSREMGQLTKLTLGTKNAITLVPAQS